MAAAVPMEWGLRLLVKCVKSIISPGRTETGFYYQSAPPHAVIVGQADQPSRFIRDSPGLGYSVPKSRTLSSGRQNVPVWLQKSRPGQNAIQVINYIASFGRYCYPFTLNLIT